MEPEQPKPSVPGTSVHEPSVASPVVMASPTSVMAPMMVPSFGATVTAVTTLISAIAAAVVAIIVALRTGDLAAKTEIIKDKAYTNEQKIDGITVLVDGRMTEALKKIADLETQVSKLTPLDKGAAARADKAQKAADKSEEVAEEAHAVAESPTPLPAPAPPRRRKPTPASGGNP